MNYKSKIIGKIILYSFIGFLSCTKVLAQVPSEVSSISNTKLEDGQKKLQSLGYELCFSSLFGKKQDWYNEKSKICVTVMFDKKKNITEVLQKKEISECQKGLEASRKVWENYHNGQASVSNTKIDEERNKLMNKGYKVSYWINDVSPGRCAEYWVNDNTQSTMVIVWEIQGNKWVMTNKSDYKMGKNPAPKK